MKLSRGRIGIAVIVAALVAALWQLRENGRELERLRAEAAELRAAPAARAPLPGGRPGAGAAAAGSRTASTERVGREESMPADFAALPAEERAAFLKHWQEERERRRAAEEAARAVAERNKGPQADSYAGGKATGAPDAEEHGGDSARAWCPAPRSASGEWLKLSYGKAVQIAEIAIHETYATGALSRVVALMPDGRERVLWEGAEPIETPPVQRIVPVPAGVSTHQIRIELDTTRTSNWQEIDAVELVGRDGSRQWAKEAEASSYWGSR